jgi:predicted nucleic acid-binding protein
MPLYMLDTDTSSLIMNYKSEPVLARLQRVGVHDVCISVITKCELLFGVEKSPAMPPFTTRKFVTDSDAAAI